MALFTLLATVFLAWLQLDVSSAKEYNFPLGLGSDSDVNAALPNNANGGQNPKPSVDLKGQFDRNNAAVEDIKARFRSDSNIHVNANPNANANANVNANIHERPQKRAKRNDMDKMFEMQRKQPPPPSKSENKVDWTTFSMDGFWPSLSMIIVSELGDKTFFIASILAMKHSRLIVWLGAAGALFVMTILAVVFGSVLQVVPSYITHYGAGFLFLFFGVKLLYDARGMKGGEASDELREAEEELKEAERQEKKRKIEAEKVENRDPELGGNVMGGPNGDHEDSVMIDVDTEYKKKMSKGWDLKILIRSFALTFVSEIGDRSQITTVVLAAHKNPYGVTVGASLGHGLCTALAVIGGKLLASKISEKNVTIIGGVLFLAFSLECFIYGPA